MKKFFKVVLVIVFIWLLLILYNRVALQLENNYYETEIVYTSSVANSFDARAIILKDEVLIQNKENSIASYFVGEGEKLASGDVIANIYTSDDGAKYIYELQDLEREIKLLSEVKLLKNSRNMTSEILYSQITDNLGGLIDSSRRNTMADFKNYKDALFMSLIKKNLVYGSIEGLNEKIESLNKAVYDLKRKSSSYKTINAPEDGYFSSEIDGYESILNLDIENDSYEDCLKLIKAKPASVKESEYIGKLITDFDWYIVLETDKKNIEKLGGTIFVNMSSSSFSEESIPAVVMDIKSSGSSGRSIIILKSNYMSDDIAGLRRCNITISTRSFYGLLVNSQAIRFWQDQRGVFIREGKEIKFKKIDPIFETEKKFISKLNPLDDDYLQAFDEVILKGQGLYDGKKLNH